MRKTQPKVVRGRKMRSHTLSESPALRALVGKQSHDQGTGAPREHHDGNVALLWGHIERK